MAKTKEPVITVSTIFAGKQSDRQAFIDLIIRKNEVDKSQLSLDKYSPMRYNKITPNCGIHSRTEVVNES